eukprot:9851805-Heterocapsa_arctica.AAC.1
MDRLAIFRTLSLNTLTLYGPPRVASTPRSLTEKEMSGTSSKASLKACLAVGFGSYGEDDRLGRLEPLPDFL